MKYSPEGGPVLARALPTDDGVELIVADEGIGITPEQAELVFERFFQADAGHGARRFSGLGLGLSITKAIVVAHGGEIHAAPNTAAGHGTIITVRLPRRAVVPADQQPVTDAPPPFVLRRG